MADTVKIKDSDLELANRKKIKEQFKAAQPEVIPVSQDEKTQAQVMALIILRDAAQPAEQKLIPPYYATERFCTNLGPTGDKRWFEFNQFDIITDQYTLHWLLFEKDPRVVLVDVDAVKCPKCKTIFAGKTCLAP